MSTNHYINQNVKSEQSLFEDLIIESVKFYGTNVYYLPRDIVNEDNIWMDDVPSKFNSSYVIEMYPLNNDGFGGDGDLFTKFGIEIRDQATFVVARRRWNEAVYKFDNEISTARPAEGDLIYLPLSKSIFEIMKVEHESPFYQLSNLVVYELHCELFEYNDEKMDTNIEAIDNIELSGYQLALTLVDSADNDFVIGNTLSQTLAGAVTISGEIIDYNDFDNVITVAHIGADDGNYHMFVTGRATSLASDSSDINRTISFVGEQFGDQTMDRFDAKSFDFIDFSESNPFGEPG